MKCQAIILNVQEQFNLQSQSTQQMMSSPVSGLHHMQQLLQQQVLSPTQLQTLMKQHSILQHQQQQQVRYFMCISIPSNNFGTYAYVVLIKYFLFIKYSVFSNINWLK